MIAIVDYGRGNLASVQRAFARVGEPALVTQEARVVDDADAVVIPGDGAFHDAMGSLEALGLVPALFLFAILPVLNPPLACRENEGRPSLVNPPSETYRLVRWVHLDPKE